MKTKLERDRQELERLCVHYGIHSVAAVMARTCEHVGGLGFVQRVIADLTESKLRKAEIMEVTP